MGLSRGGLVSRAHYLADCPNLCKAGPLFQDFEWSQIGNGHHSSEGVGDCSLAGRHPFLFLLSGYFLSCFIFVD